MDEERDQRGLSEILRGDVQIRMKFDIKKVDRKKCAQILLLAVFTVGIIWLAKSVLVGVNLPSDSFKVLGMTIVAVIVVLIWFVFLAAERGIWNLERIYVLCGLTMGIVYLFVIPPYATPDEVAHINSAYHVSNVILHTTGENEGGGIIAKRECDTKEFSDAINRQAYNSMIDSLFQKTGDTSIKEKHCVYATPYLLYFVSGTGIAFARLLHLNWMAALLMGGFFNVSFFVGMMYYAMKKLPFGKIALFAVCMMPMTLQQTSSFSYDQMAITMAFLVTALALRFAYGEEPVKKSEIVVYILASAMLVVAKGGAYSAIVFLPFLLMFSKDKLTKRNLLCAGGFTAGMALILLRGKIASLFAGGGTAVTTAVNAVTEQEGAYIAWADSYAYSLSELLHQPRLFLQILINTFQTNLDFYMETMIGSHLGWLAIDVATVYLYGFVAVLFVGVFCREGEPAGMRMKDRIGMWIIGASGIGASLMAMLLYWTPKETGSILGVQGRYFIPVLFLMALTLRNRAIIIKKNLNKVLVLTLLILELIVVISVLQNSVYAF